MKPDDWDRATMTTREFIDRKNRYYKAVALPCLAEIALLAVPPLVLLIAVCRLESLLDPWIVAFFSILLVILMVAHIAVWSPRLRRFAVFARKTYTGLGLLCPHCQSFLTGPRLTKRVIASGKCSHCGGRVLDDDR